MGKRREQRIYDNLLLAYAKVANLPTDPADESNLIAAVAAVKAVVDAVLVDTGTTLDTKVNTLQSSIDAGFELTGDAVVGNVLTDKTFYKDDFKTKLTGTMVNHTTDITATSISRDGDTLKFLVPAGYYPGTINVTYQDTDFVEGNILDGVTIFGLLGTHV